MDRHSVLRTKAIWKAVQTGWIQWKGTCPFCKTPECFVVSNQGGKDKTGAFNCFKCPAGGDQIELVSLVRGHGRKDAKGAFAAAKELHEKFIGSAETAKAANSSGDASPQPMAEKRKGFDAEAYAKTLDPGHEALAAFGIDPETFRSWRSGYAPAGVNRGRLALPVTARDGTIIGYVGRTLKHETPNLTVPNGLAAQEHIFGVDRVTSGPLTLLRDPVDVLRATESGCDNVICFFTQDITAAQLAILAALMDERKCGSLTFF